MIFLDFFFLLQGKLFPSHRNLGEIRSNHLEKQMDATPGAKGDDASPLGTLRSADVQIWNASASPRI